eukprot:1557996-Alexandrium_andersonii.AAC.1
MAFAIRGKNRRQSPSAWRVAVRSTGVHSARSDWQRMKLPAGSSASRRARRTAWAARARSRCGGKAAASRRS